MMAASQDEADVAPPGATWTTTPRQFRHPRPIHHGSLHDSRQSRFVAMALVSVFSRRRGIVIMNIMLASVTDVPAKSVAPSLGARKNAHLCNSHGIRRARCLWRLIGIITRISPSAW